MSGKKHNAESLDAKSLRVQCLFQFLLENLEALRKKKKKRESYNRHFFLGITITLLCHHHYSSNNVTFMEFQLPCNLGELWNGSSNVLSGTGCWLGNA